MRGLGNLHRHQSGPSHPRVIRRHLRGSRSDRRRLGTHPARTPATRRHAGGGSVCSCPRMSRTVSRSGRFWSWAPIEPSYFSSIPSLTGRALASGLFHPVPIPMRISSTRPPVGTGLAVLGRDDLRRVLLDAPHFADLVPSGACRPQCRAAARSPCRFFWRLTLFSLRMTVESVPLSLPVPSCNSPMSWLVSRQP